MIIFLQLFRHKPDVVLLQIYSTIESTYEKLACVAGVNGEGEREQERGRRGTGD